MLLYSLCGPSKMRVSSGMCSSELRARWLQIDRISRATDMSMPLLHAIHDARNCIAWITYATNSKLKTKLHHINCEPKNTSKRFIIISSTKSGQFWQNFVHIVPRIFATKWHLFLISPPRLASSCSPPCDTNTSDSSLHIQISRGSSSSNNNNNNTNNLSIAISLAGISSCNTECDSDQMLLSYWPVYNV